MTQTKYLAIRKSLVPIATEYANRQAGPMPRSGKKNHCGESARVRWGSEWNKLFHAEMGRLCVEAGLVQP